MEGIRWHQLVELWDLVVCDLASEYGVREWECEGMPWPRFQDLVFGLLNRPQSLVRAALLSD